MPKKESFSEIQQVSRKDTLKRILGIGIVVAVIVGAAAAIRFINTEPAPEVAPPEAPTPPPVPTSINYYDPSGEETYTTGVDYIIMTRDGNRIRVGADGSVFLVDENGRIIRMLTGSERDRAIEQALEIQGYDSEVNIALSGLEDIVGPDEPVEPVVEPMTTEDMIEAAKLFEKVGFYSVEVWGGATYDACLRYAKEDPFERLATFKDIFKTTSLQMLLRGQNLIGYRHYADDVVREFIRLSAQAGMDIFRIFDAFNDARNLKTSIESVKNNGKHAQGAICYTTSPVHTTQGFVAYAKELVKMGEVAQKSMVVMKAMEQNWLPALPERWVPRWASPLPQATCSWVIST